MKWKSRPGTAASSSTLEPSPDSKQQLVDGALDTLTSIVRITGSESIPLGDEQADEHFADVCVDLASHIENGAAVPEFNIEYDSSGQRNWLIIQRVLVDRRRQEKAFVSQRTDGYRDIVNELVSGFRQISRGDQDTATNIKDSLDSLQNAVGDDELPLVQAALAETITKVSDILAAQRERYDSQLRQINSRMLNLRQELVFAREEMKQDALTQTYNRGAFDSAITQSLNLHYISQQPVTLLMVDLDNFKLVNDSFGHGAGDAVLRAIGDCLSRSFIRKNDFVARYGGDEFAVILPDTGAKDATGLVKRLIERIREIKIEADGQIINISCSVGFTEATGQDTVETFSYRADKALLKAKSNGRNQSSYLPSDVDF